MFDDLLDVLPEEERRIRKPPHRYAAVYDVLDEYEAFLDAEQSHRIKRVKRHEGEWEEWEKDVSRRDKRREARYDRSKRM
ncbi:MAG: hypothetical protein K8L97_03670 [Anaerolineae bacterium]|nr:hypothetical protein [Anaerolineae bacterium]